MDSETKKAASKKITAMKTFIGYPKWLADNETLQEMYKYVSALFTITNFHVSLRLLPSHEGVAAEDSCDQGQRRRRV